MTEEEKTEFLAEIDEVLDVLREGIRMHAGDVELVGFDEEHGRVTVRFTGTCVGCPLSDVTLKAGIEETLCGIFPEIREVVGV